MMKIKNFPLARKIDGRREAFCDDLNRHCDDCVTIIEKRESSIFYKGAAAVCDDVTIIFPILYKREEKRKEGEKETITRARARVRAYTIRRFFRWRTFDGSTVGVMCDIVKQTKPTKDAYFAMRMPKQTLDALRSAAENDRRSVSDFALGVLQKHLAFLVTSGVVSV